MTGKVTWLVTWKVSVKHWVLSATFLPAIAACDPIAKVTVTVEVLGPVIWKDWKSNLIYK